MDNVLDCYRKFVAVVNDQHVNGIFGNNEFGPRCSRMEVRRNAPLGSRIAAEADLKVTDPNRERKVGEYLLILSTSAASPFYVQVDRICKH